MIMLGSVSAIDLRLLRVFVTVAQCGGFAAAQSALNVSQANISMQMKQLEERLGLKLCHRGRGGFWLTKEGKEVYDSCQTLFRSLDEFRSSVASSSGKLGGRLSIAVIDNSIFNPGFRLSEAIGNFKRAVKESEVNLNVVSPNAVEQMILDGSCDLGIGFFPARRQGLEYVPLFTSDMNLYCGRGSPLFDKAPDELEVEEVFASEHAARGYVSSAQLPTFERKFLVGASSSSVEGLVTLILTGQYTAYLPAHYARHWVKTDELRPMLADKISYTSLYELTMKKENRRNELLRTLVDHLVQVHPQISDEQDFRIGTDLPGDESS